MKRRFIGTRMQPARCLDRRLNYGQTIFTRGFDEKLATCHTPVSYSSGANTKRFGSGSTRLRLIVMATTYSIFRDRRGPIGRSMTAYRIHPGVLAAWTGSRNRARKNQDE